MATMKSDKTSKSKNLVVKTSNHITMSNALNRASHNLTLPEKRLIAISISLLDSRKDLRPGQCPVVTFKSAEYAETFGVEMVTAYEQMKEGARNLYERTIRFSEGEGKSRSQWQMRWVGKAGYHEKEGWVELHFWHELVPHLLGLKRDFTSYQLKQTNALRSVYSWRLMELFASFKNKGWMEISIEDFNMAMEITEKQAINFSYARRRVIEPAIRELQDKNGLEIKWKQIKAGVRVSKLHFTFNERAQKDIFMDNVPY